MPVSLKYTGYFRSSIQILNISVVLSCNWYFISILHSNVQSTCNLYLNKLTQQLKWSVYKKKIVSKIVFASVQYKERSEVKVVKSCLIL